MLTNRETADYCYGAFAGMGAGNVLGVDPDVVTAARIATCVAAERAITRALEGPERILCSEPDDARLRRWLQQVQRRRDELQTT